MIFSEIFNIDRLITAKLHKTLMNYVLLNYPYDSLSIGENSFGSF